MVSSGNSKETGKRKVEEEMRKFNENGLLNIFLSKMQTVDPCV